MFNFVEDTNMIGAGTPFTWTEVPWQVVGKPLAVVQVMPEAGPKLEPSTESASSGAIAPEAKEIVFTTPVTIGACPKIGNVAKKTQHRALLSLQIVLKRDTSG
jgi:hypothetical protein